MWPFDSGVEGVDGDVVVSAGDCQYSLNKTRLRAQKSISHLK